MLTTLSLRNFKSWKSVEKMSVRALTGLFGTNSAGKSGLLQSLLLFKQTKDSPDRGQVLNLGDASSYANLGTFRDLIHNHNESLPFRFRVTWTTPEALIVDDPQTRDETLWEDDALSLDVSVSLEVSGNVAVDSMTYEFAGLHFALKKRSGEGRYNLTVSQNDRFHLVRIRGRPWDPPGPVKFYGFPDQVRTYYQNTSFLADFERSFEEQLDHIFYLGPLREYPKREYLWAGSRPTDVGRRGERAIDALLAARTRGDKIKLGRGRGKRTFSLEEYVAARLRDLGLIHSFIVEEIAPHSNLYRVKVKVEERSADALITDVGFGVSQVLPVLILLYYVPVGSTVILEQPEIHLHPLVQSGLADVFMDAIKVRGIQIILESHSEHLLRRLQRRIAEDAFSADQTALYFCDVENGVSVFTPLRINELGNIENWPPNFFGDEMGEISAMQRAALERQLHAAE